MPLTAAPGRPDRSPPSSRSSAARCFRRPLGTLAAILGLGLAAPASAQIAGSASLVSDYRHRGYSLSSGHPVATLDVGYDDPSGVYLAASGMAVFESEGPDLLGFHANVGYAARLGPTMSVDGGILRSEYSSSLSGGRSAHYTEFYVGLTRRPFSFHLYFSPDYFRSGIYTLYGEAEGFIQPAAKWRLNAHVGSLLYLDLPRGYPSRSTRYDWRLSVSRELGPAEAYVALSGGGPSGGYYGNYRYSYGDHGYYAGPSGSKTALVAGLTLAF